MTLQVESLGAGRDLVLLHGWGMHGGVWQGIARRLAARFRLYLVDLPGYGGSPPCRPYTLARIADLLAEFLPERVCVCGWSLGGQVALAWALARPGQVERLALAAATPRFVLGPDWPHGIERAVFDQFADTLQRDYAGTLKRFLSLQARNGDQAREVIGRLRAELFARGRPAAAVLQGGLDLLLTGDLRHQAAQVEQPALLIHGERDTLVPPGAARWLAGRLPAARLEVVPGAAHAPFLSHEAVFADRLAEFMDE